MTLKLAPRFLLLFLITIFSPTAYSQVTQVGNGSYSNVFPGKDQAGRNDVPPGTPQLSGNAVGKPIPTNDWWSLLLRENHVSNLFNYPMTMKTKPSGLVTTYIPKGVIDDQEPIIIGVDGLNAGQATISDYSDWTVTINWDNRFQVTSGIGMPFLYFETGESEIAKVVVNLGSVTVLGNIIIVTNARNGADFAIYAPSGSSWSQSGSTYTSSLNGKNYFSAVMLPQDVSNPVSVAQDFQQYAFAFPQNTETSWSYDEQNSTLTTDFQVQTIAKEGTNTDIIMGLLPHQWSKLSPASPSPNGYSYSSIRGEMKTLIGTEFQTEATFYGILPTLPDLSKFSEGYDPTLLDQKVSLLENEGLSTWTDSYNEGQVMNRLIQTARIADKMGNTEARDKMILTVKERLEDWLTAEPGEVAFLFYYNPTWTALLGYPSGHGQDSNINDHHFHWGYFIHAAAFIEQFEPGWASQWGEMVNHLVRDAASSDREDPLFPFLRNFSPYAGHCWANGFATFPQGNDQESTSESMQFNSSLIHWGSVTGNDEIRDLGIYLYTTEQAAVEEYWFDINERIFPENPYSLVSRVWGNSYDNGTFWTNDIAASYGIELYPIHGGSMYLGHNIPYAENLWAEIERNTGILSNEVNPNLWHDVMWKYLAFTDPAKAIGLYNNYTERNIKFGVSDAHTYYWLHSMNAIGQVDATVTADHPLAVVFSNTGSRTYVAHNYSNAPIDVTFSDGFVLNVPAKSMNTNRNLDLDASLESLFSTANPGGSAQLSLEINGGAADRVELYQNNQLIAEDPSIPFEFVAEELTAGVHKFYAKMYADGSFDLSNSVSITVGTQQPYSGIPAPLPGTIDAGHYDVFEGAKGQGISYQDNSPGNEGDFRVNEDVDVTSSPTEGPTIGYINAGEWVEYTIAAESSGYYDLSIRFASGNTNGGGPFHLEIDGEQISEDIFLTYTGDWNSWQSMAISDIPIHEGNHILRVAFENGEFNLGRMQFALSGNLPYNPPIARAGDNISLIAPASTTMLDASSSSDADGDVLEFLWEQINGPSLVDFSDPTIADPTVSNLVGGVYRIRLNVSDGGHSSTDELLIIVSETGNTPPTVSLTSPQNDQEFEVGATIPLAASATDLEGAVSKVEFFDGQFKVGEDMAAPFDFSFENASLGNHLFSAVATDENGAQSTSSAVSATVVDPKECTQTDAEAQQGSFSTGYESTFKTIGSSVQITFKLLDTDKDGVVAYLWKEAPFGETQMQNVGDRTFQATIGGMSSGETISYACKFAFAGGLAVTKYISYTVGSNCQVVVEDTDAPTDFFASLVAVSESEASFLASASDNSGEVIYEVQYATSTKNIDGLSAEEIAITLSGLEAGQQYEAQIYAKDAAGNVAPNSPIVIPFTTIDPAAELPSDFTASIEEIGHDHVAFALHAVDDAGDITFKIKFGASTLAVTSPSDVTRAIQVNGLQPETAYEFAIHAEDEDGNVADNSPIMLSAITLSDVPLAINSKSLSVYPNPVTEWLTIDMDEASNTSFVNCFNIMGKTVDIDIRQQQGKIQLNFSGLQSGMYFVRILKENKAEPIDLRVFKK